MRSSATLPALALLVLTISGCGGATEAECKAAYAKTLDGLVGDKELSEKAQQSASELETKYVSGCMKSRKKGFGDCVVAAPDAKGRMECTVRFSK
jgi:hypothetical protein